MSAPDPTPDARDLTLPDEAATARLARRVAERAEAGDVIALGGDLGAGKTAFARAFVSALPRPDGSEAREEVPSPTFTLVQTYDRAPAPVWHVDLYRLEDPEEVLELGLEEAVIDSIVLIEWPERMGPYLPHDRLDIVFEIGGDGHARRAELRAGPAWRDRLAGIVADA